MWHTEILPYTADLRPEKVLPETPRRDGNFFLSRTWINSYVSHWSSHEHYGVLRLIARNDNHSPTLFSWISKCDRKSALGFRIRALGFNFNPRLNDRNISIEANDFYESERNSNHASKQVNNSTFQSPFACMLECLRARNDWDELHLNIVDDCQAKALRKAAKCNKLLIQETGRDTTFSVDFDLIRERHHGEYISTRSPNTRQKLRRARKAVDQFAGTPILETPNDLTQALEWFADLARLHMLRWPLKGSDAFGFHDVGFRQFHEQLAVLLWHSKQFNLVRVSAGQLLLGYIYNITYCGTIHFLMSGINYVEAKQFQPGFLCHLLAIENGILTDAKRYDFLVGAAQYKESLSTDQQKFSSFVVRRRTSLFQIEQFARSIKQLFKFLMKKR
jgi:Acetyltransferase (GNAT) domain